MIKITNKIKADVMKSTLMKYYIYFNDEEKQIECTKEIFQLNTGDNIWLNNKNYKVKSKTIDYDEKSFFVNVTLDE